LAGGGATYPGFDDLAHLASVRAGVLDVTTDALGGTGYVAVNPATHFPTYLTRARLDLNARRAQPQLIVIGGSINDASVGEARVRSAARALYQYLARALPKAAVVVVPFTPGYPVPRGVAAANRGILSAARSAPNVVGALDLPAEVLALGGTAGAQRRSGSLVSSVVNYHPSEAGHQLYGRLIGNFLATCIRRLRLAGASRGLCDKPT
jgi:lysophospholipase L1-like esterase